MSVRLYDLASRLIDSIGETMAARVRAFEAVLRERDYQERKWGSIAEHPHEVGSWLLIMEKCLADARVAYCTARGDEAAIREIVQVVATGFACMEQHGVFERPPSPALPSREPAVGNKPWSCPACGVTHSRGPTQPGGSSYRCLNCGDTFHP